MTRMERSLASPACTALRRVRSSLASHACLVTVLTHARRPLFLDRELARAVARLSSDRAQWRGARVLCWVLMPDHWHGIVESEHHESLPDLVRRFKQASAAEANRDRRATGNVWACGYHEHALRYEEDLVGVARYVVENPLRAGIVDRIGDWPYWDAVWL